MKYKIQSISEMEKILLDDTDVQDIHAIKSNEAVEQNLTKKISAEQVRKDISVIARTLIKGYCGWPFHKELLKHTTLTGLLNIYNNASEVSVENFFELLKPIIKKIPDNHIRLILGENIAKTSLSHKNKDVGKNLATWGDRLKIEKRDDIVILAIRTLSDWKEEDYEKLKKLEKIIIGSKCLIVDLRHNGGGNSRPIEYLADFLYGAETRGAIRTYIRTTPEAKIIQSINPNQGWEKLDKTKDPTIWADYIGIPYPKFSSEKPGYEKPIYILTDGYTGSSAEIFILRMNKHPYVKYVGDNSAGMEVYGYMGHVIIPNSQIKFAIGNVYRELEIKDFELKGYPPDILCNDGEDALDMAIFDYKTSQKFRNISKNSEKIL